MNAKVVIAALVQKFGSEVKAPNKAEMDMISHISSLLQSDMEIVADVRTLGFAAGDGDEWDESMELGDEPDECEASSSQQSKASSEGSGLDPRWSPSPKKKKRISGDMLSEGDWTKYKSDAYHYWTVDPKTGEQRDKRLSGKTVMNQYSRIKSMNLLYNYEKKLNKPSLHSINMAVLDVFKEKEAEGAVIHDRTLRIWAMSAKRELDPDNTIAFKASPSWVYRFKKRNNITDRAITHRVSRNWKEKETNLEALSDEFVEQLRGLIVSGHYTPTGVMNADQSRFDKELHGHRSLRTKGTKIVRAVVGSVAATTHSYMIMPVISMDGEIMRPMYVLVSESNGRFPENKPSDPANIKSYAGRTANMSKEDLKTWYKDVFWPSLPGDRNKVLLILDSWAANRDSALSDSFVPEGVNFQKRLVPGGCTGKIQPLDVHFFRQYKSFVRYITDTVIMETTAKVWHRDQFLALQSFTVYQFSAPRFKNLIRYAFYKAGYLDEEPGMWVSPHDFCFDSIENDECSKESCNQLAFVKCAHCENTFCSDHALFIDLHIDCL